MATKELSKYYSNNQQKIATVFTNFEEKNTFFVSFKDEFGSSYIATYFTEEAAESAAEDWVL